MESLQHFNFFIAPIKIIFTIFAVFAWTGAYLKFRKRLLNYKELIFWSVLWIGMIILVFIPGKTDFLAKLLGMNRGLDAMFFFSVVALFYAVYRLYVKVNDLERQLTELVREIALRVGTETARKK